MITHAVARRFLEGFVLENRRLLVSSFLLSGTTQIFPHFKLLLLEQSFYITTCRRIYEGNETLLDHSPKGDARTLTVFLKMRFQLSNGMFKGSHSTSTEVSLTDLNFRPSGSGRSDRKIEQLSRIYSGQNNK